MAQLRSITKKFGAKPTTEGPGVAIYRSVGDLPLKYFDPFLLLDEFSVGGGPAGFPDHPHRGLETLTYLFKGKTLHEDFMGNKGVMTAGGVQWMRAGKAIVHCEGPADIDNHGMQLWVNLPSRAKFIDPHFFEYNASELPTPALPNNAGKVKIIAGDAFEETARIKHVTPVTFHHYFLKPSKSVEMVRFQLQLPPNKIATKAVAALG
ncbi:hypothetical protein HDU93_007329 [Gonapodya sp. JEL0774]|nr:hypothetical protein HDU93_007329 [Gonapodya sp. JEL0774]